jgi:predicted CoA-binding protein
MRSRISDFEIRRILSEYRVIAVVGLSRDPSKDSYRVAEYLKRNGFKVIPINPKTSRILDEACYGSLLEVPVEVQREIEIINIFRPSDQVLPIVEQAIQIRKSFGKPYVIWMQLGVINELAAEIAEENGLIVVMDRCIMREHKRFFGS